MIDSLYLAWTYLRFHKVKTTILVTSITLIVYLPAAIDALVSESAEQLRDRAAATPLIVGAKGSEVDLVLNTLYFDSDSPSAIAMAEADRAVESGFAEVIPLHVRFRAQKHRIVGTTLDYFKFRGLHVERGRPFAMLGECVLGSDVAATLALTPDDTLLSSPENVFNLDAPLPRRRQAPILPAPPLPLLPEGSPPAAIDRLTEPDRIEIKIREPIPVPSPER